MILAIPLILGLIVLWAYKFCCPTDKGPTP